MLADILRRTKYFITNPAKFTEMGANSGQDEVGSRYFEGAAAGAILVGKPPSSPVFSYYFPHDDAVVEVPYDGSGLPMLYDELESDAERTNRIRTDNLRQSLLHNDWAYHWKDVLTKLGLEPLPQLTSRFELLRNLADKLPNDIPNFMGVRGK